MQLIVLNLRVMSEDKKSTVLREIVEKVESALMDCPLSCEIGDIHLVNAED